MKNNFVKGEEPFNGNLQKIGHYYVYKFLKENFSENAELEIRIIDDNNLKVEDINGDAMILSYNKDRKKVTNYQGGACRYVLQDKREES